MQAREAYAEIWSEVLATNRYLKLAVGALCALCLGLMLLCWRTFDRFEHLAPLVLRIDEVGRAEALSYGAAAYRPDATKPEVKYFLRQFLTLHRERRRGVALDTWKRSLLFLDGPLARRLLAEQEASGELVQFLGGLGMETEVAVDAVRIRPTREEPYRAHLDFTEIRRDGTGREVERVRWASEFEFRFLKETPPELLPVNPIGLSITYFRADRVAE